MHDNVDDEEDDDDGAALPMIIARGQERSFRRDLTLILQWNQTGSSKAKLSQYSHVTHMAGNGDSKIVVVFNALFHCC